jgi:pyridoxamine 5'-phosphate oxidase
MPEGLEEGGVMTKEEILTFINENRTAYVATVEGDAPHVRAMGTYKADEQGILIQLSAVKEMYQQLVKNPNVEICYSGPGKQVRISGTAEFLEEKEVKEQVLKDRPFLKGLADEKGLDIIKVFRVKDPVATVWTMATNFAPKEYTKL